MTTVTVCVPTILPRLDGPELLRAFTSITQQTRQPNLVNVFVDHEGEGAASSRNALLDTVTTDFIAWLDDDDQLLPNHLEALIHEQQETGADLVYPGYQENINRTSYMYGGLDGPFNETALRQANYIPITYLVRTELAQKARFPEPGDEDYKGGGTAPLEDYAHLLRLLDFGANFHHLPSVTWQWNHHEHNTSGKPWVNIYG